MTGIRWAVLDTGIDARHPAFRKRDADGNIPAGQNPSDAAANSRVVKTYDFLRIKDLLDPDVPISTEGTDPAQTRELQDTRDDLQRSLAAWSRD